MIRFFLLIFCFVNINNFAYSQSNNHFMSVKTTTVFIGQTSANSSGSLPIKYATIQVEGSPSNSTPPSSVKKFILHFYEDSRAEQKPLINEKNTEVKSFYPYSEFEKYYELLKQKNLVIRYLDQVSQATKEVSISTFGTVPLR